MSRDSNATSASTPTRADRDPVDDDPVEVAGFACAASEPSMVRPDEKTNTETTVAARRQTVITIWTLPVGNRVRCGVLSIGGNCQARLVRQDYSLHSISK